jgi:hypothetical protein
MKYRSCKYFCGLALFFALATSAFADECDFAGDIAAGENSWPLERLKSCYRSVPLNQKDVENTVEVMLFALEQSALRNVYKNDLGLGDRISALRDADYASDWDFQQAALSAMRAPGNSHLWYSQPACYRQFIVAQPFEFGSMLYRGEQIVYVGNIRDFTPIGLPADFFNKSTGIDDLEQYVGMRIKSMNGVDALTALTRLSDVYSGLSEGNEFNSNVLTSYTTSNGVASIDENITYVLADKQGTELILEVPAVVTHASLTNLSFNYLSPPTKVRRFISECTAPNALTADLNGVYDEIARRLKRRQANNTEESPLLLAKGKMQQHRNRESMVGDPEQARETPENLEKAVNRRIKNDKLKGYSGHAKKNIDDTIMFSELLEEEKGVLIEELIPYDENIGLGASIYNDGEAVAITFADFTPTIGLALDAYAQIVIDATNYACNSPSTKRLILDVRNAPGGSVDVVNWLSTFFHGVSKNSIGSYQFVSYLPVTTDMNIAKGTAWARFLEEVWPNKPLDLCYGAEDTPTSGCLIDPDTGALNTDISWLTNPVSIDIGGVPELLGQPNIFVGGNTHDTLPDIGIACPDKFRDEKLVILLDGLGRSAGAFFPYLISDIGTLVGVGGLVENSSDPESLKMGSGMGGPGAQFMNNTAYWHAYDLFDLVSAGVDPAQMVPTVSVERPPLFRREVEVAFEYVAFRTLEGNGPISNDFPRSPPVDLRVFTWQGIDSPESNGYVYREVLQMIKTGNSVTPVSHQGLN